MGWLRLQHLGGHNSAHNKWAGETIELSLLSSSLCQEEKSFPDSPQQSSFCFCTAWARPQGSRVGVTVAPPASPPSWSRPPVSDRTPGQGTKLHPTAGPCRCLGCSGEPGMSAVELVSSGCTPKGPWPRLEAAGEQRGVCSSPSLHCPPLPVARWSPQLQGCRKCVTGWLPQVGVELEAGQGGVLWPEDVGSS